MDLHFTADEPTAEEREAVDRHLAGLAAEGAQPDAPARGSLRQHLLPVLHALQDRVGWISPGGLNHACRRLEVPPAEAFGVADFYALFQTRPQPPLAVHVCDDIACLARGAERLCGEMARALGPAGGAGAGLAWHRSPCLGLCERAPAALLVRAGDPPLDLALAPADAAGIQAAVAEISAAAAAGRTPAGNGGAVPGGGAGAFGGAAAGSSGNGGPAPPSSPSVASPAAAAAPGQAPGAPAARLAAGFEPPLSLSVPQLGAAGLVLLAGVGRVDPWSLDDYRAAGGFLALRRALEMGPDQVLREVVESKLVGRGGAAFPTGQKWQGARAAAAPRYLVCNADESEPGTFKDRVLMEHDPYALVEAMTVAGFAAGCERGYLYIRGEYPVATARLRNAIARCRERGFLGKDLLGSGVGFEIELRRGAGAYICGEETALLNSLEGRRGEPRNKPPFPTQAGLFGRPTVINNVETLVNVLPIVVHGGRAFASVGTEKSTGTKLFCLSGHVARPGVYEFPFGITLGGLIEAAGGIAGTGKLQAVLLGGAAGGFVTPAQLDVPLTFEGTRAAGAALGSAVVMPFDDSVDLGRILHRIARFFRDESCGQCVPCRVGTVRQEELLDRLAAGRPIGPVAQELGLLKDLGQVMRDASICGLGQTASAAIESALARFPVFRQDAGGEV